MKRILWISSTLFAIPVQVLATPPTPPRVDGGVNRETDVNAFVVFVGEAAPVIFAVFIPTMIYAIVVYLGTNNQTTKKVALVTITACVSVLALLSLIMFFVA